MIALSAEHHPAHLPHSGFAVWFVPEGSLFRKEAERIRRTFPDCAHAVAASAFRGKLQETLLLFPREGPVRRLLAVGLGEPSKLDAERLRRAATTAVRSAEQQQSPSVHLMEPSDEVRLAAGGGTAEGTVLALFEGAALAAYRYDRYRTRARKTATPVIRISCVTTRRSRLAPLRAVARRAAIECGGTFLARDLENAPGNEIYPETLARRAAAAGRAAGFRVAVLKPTALRRLRMGGLLAVSAGSAKPPRLIVMTHGGGPRAGRPVVLVGKGVTFDSGGISIKPSANMAEMKMDMSGAAAVVGTMQAAARLRLPIHLIGIIPATENLPGGSALKPGDIITHQNGLTSEIDNTDAEGRLILADALSYAARFRPDLIIDLATLTGAVVVALGHEATGMMGTDQDAMDQLRLCGEQTGERVWQLPLFEDYERLIKSDVADVKNVGGRWAGAITAAMFLKQFVGSNRWVHLDIAGTAIMEESFEYIPKGGSGVGVRLLIDFLRRRTGRRRR